MTGIRSTIGATALTSGTITASQGGSKAPGMAMLAKVLTGQAATPVGTTGGTTSTTPSLAITPAATGSIVYGSDLGLAGTYTPNAATTYQQNTSGGGLEFISMRATALTTAATPVTVGGTAGVSSIAVALAEIQAGTGLAEDPSAPAGVSSGALEALTTGTFTPPGGSLLEVGVQSNGAAGVTTMAMSDTFGGLVWTEQPGKQNGAGNGYAGIFTAPAPAATTVASMLLDTSGILNQFGAGPVFATALSTGPAAGGFHALTAQPSTNIPNVGPFPPFVQTLGDGSLLVSGCSFSSTLVCDASNIAFVGCQFTATGNYAVQPGPDAVGPWKFLYCQASAPDNTVANNLLFGFPLPDGLSNVNRSLIDHCNLFWFSGQPAIAINNATISNNYIHDTVEVPTKHCESIYIGTQGGGGVGTNITVSGNQLAPGPSTNNTAACYLDAHGNAYSNIQITGNLMSGGDFTLYLGIQNGGTDANVVVTGNRFSTVITPTSGQFGYATDAPAWGTGGNVWSDNRWYDGATPGVLLPQP
jgi:hypothetical protein